jgi:hypothetical protein
VCSYAPLAAGPMHRSSDALIELAAYPLSLAACWRMMGTRAVASDPRGVGFCDAGLARLAAPQVRCLFAMARHHAPATLFFDEIDGDYTTRLPRPDNLPRPDSITPPGYGGPGRC